MLKKKKKKKSQKIINGELQKKRKTKMATFFRVAEYDLLNRRGRSNE